MFAEDGKPMRKCRDNAFNMPKPCRVLSLAYIARKGHLYAFAQVLYFLRKTSALHQMLRRNSFLFSINSSKSTRLGGNFALVEKAFPVRKALISSQLWKSTSSSCVAFFKILQEQLEYPMFHSLSRVSCQRYFGYIF